MHAVATLAALAPRTEGRPPAPLSGPRYGHAAVTAADGRVYVFGGRSTATTTLASLERYDPARDAWTTLAPMPVPRFGPVGVALPDGRILSLGGLLRQRHLLERLRL
jgi:N-acetylneuraminic acid mutarotase